MLTKKKPVAKKKSLSVAGKKKSTAKRIKKTHQKIAEPFELMLHEEPSQMEPAVPHVPIMPVTPQPAEMGICKHCHLLPAAAYELVLVMVCLVFSLSAVLLTSVQTIQNQQSVIATLQKIKTTVYALR